MWEAATVPSKVLWKWEMRQFSKNSSSGYTPVASYRANPRFLVALSFSCLQNINRNELGSVSRHETWNHFQEAKFLWRTSDTPTLCRVGILYPSISNRGSSPTSGVKCQLHYGVLKLISQSTKYQSAKRRLEDYQIGISDVYLKRIMTLRNFRGRRLDQFFFFLNLLGRATRSLEYRLLKQFILFAKQSRDTHNVSRYAETAFSLSRLTLYTKIPDFCS